MSPLRQLPNRLPSFCECGHRRRIHAHGSTPGRCFECACKKFVKKEQHGKQNDDNV